MYLGAFIVMYLHNDKLQKDSPKVAQQPMNSVAWADITAVYEKR
jgi:hypothetical protein